MTAPGISTRRNPRTARRARRRGSTTASSAKGGLKAARRPCLGETLSPPNTPAPLAAGIADAAGGPHTSAPGTSSGGGGVGGAAGVSGWVVGEDRAYNCSVLSCTSHGPIVFSTPFPNSAAGIQEPFSIYSL
jgi:hypothetical protein